MEEKRKRQPDFDADGVPCPVCGGLDFRWGDPQSNGGVYFHEYGAGIFTNEGLTARACNICGNVLLFLKKVQWRD